MMLRLVVASLVIENGLYAAFRACLHSPAPTVILLHPGLGLSLSFRLRHWIQNVMTIIRAFVYPILRFVCVAFEIDIWNVCLITGAFSVQVDALPSPVPVHIALVVEFGLSYLIPADQSLGVFNSVFLRRYSTSARPISPVQHYRIPIWAGCLSNKKWMYALSG
ncbi:hypothetical protein BS47DRAFT_919262 [Hydnum rufescens UP504]|uniref:Uncharacterized protein n=1 Tax=Hydnum rufescens UP504 TaxID=1448309 RepID=A0A9P6B931_9AGAM|nr:hypothetical protein BS47DRAFT_919262 [Hydnum rufescens UP504]